MQSMRIAICFLFLLALCSAFFPVFQEPADAHVFKFAIPLPRGGPGDQEAREIFNKLARDTKGEVTVQTFDSGVGGDEIDVIRKMRANRLHMSAFTGNGLGTIVPEIRVLEMPSLFRTYEEEDFVKEQLFDYFAALFEEKGFVMLGLGGGGFVYMFTASPYVNEVSDMYKLKMWTWKGDTLTTLAFQTIGVNVFPLHIAEVNMALDNGIIDSFYITAMGSTALGWYRKARYMVNYPVGIVTGTMLVNKKAFYSLTPESQAIFREAIRGNVSRGLEMIREMDARALEILQTSGVQFISPSEEQMAFFNETSVKVANRCIEVNMFPRELFEKVQSMLRQFRSLKE